MSDELKPQSIDTLEFRNLLWDIVRTAGNERVIRDVIAHIDAWRVPEGYVLLPEVPTTKMVCAIENEVDSQLIASAMHPAGMFRQDGAHIYQALIEAAPKPEDPCGS
jgi:hypothetical protein